MMQGSPEATTKAGQDALRRLGLSAGVTVSDDHLVQVFLSAVEKYADSPVISGLGHTMTYADLREQATRFAAYLQHHTDLQPGDRIALQLPNLVQYPVVLFGSLLAGLVVVNTNPLYSERELEHQLCDSGAKALVAFAHVADKAAAILEKTAVTTVIITELGDLQPFWRRWPLNAYARYMARLVPTTQPANAVSLEQALALGADKSLQIPAIDTDAVAVLQYTGGTTGVAKGAMLSHRNLVSNMLQSRAVFSTYGLKDGGEVFLLPLPLYHIYTFQMLLMMIESGNHCILIPDPRNIKALVKEMYRYPVTSLCGINTLFAALCENRAFQQYDFSAIKVTISGGMALTRSAAQRWLEVTGNDILQGYGLTEASPVVSVNPGGGNRPGTVGIALPSTEVGILGDGDVWLGLDEPGELCLRGPQVMLGYWQRAEETGGVLSGDGWLRTGDIAKVSADGYLSIVDRKKDMIIVSGFKVFPNEIEDVLVAHPGVREAAAIGVPDDHSGEVVKVFVVRDDRALSEETLKTYCREELTGYKVPRHIVFVDELPKSNVGKILRKELRSL